MPQEAVPGLIIPPSGRTANNPASAHKDPSKSRQVRKKKIASENTGSDGYGSNSDDHLGKLRIRMFPIPTR